MKFVSYQVRKPSGKPQGELNFSYKFGEKVSNAVVTPKVYGAEPLERGGKKKKKKRKGFWSWPIVTGFRSWLKTWL